MNLRDSESVLDRLQIKVDDGPPEASYSVLVPRNHLHALLNLARAVDDLRLWEPGRTGDAAARRGLFDALAPLLTTPSEQNLQTESESRGVAPPCKGVEEGSA